MRCPPRHLKGLIRQENQVVCVLASQVSLAQAPQRGVRYWRSVHRRQTIMEPIPTSTASKLLVYLGYERHYHVYCRISIHCVQTIRPRWCLKQPVKCGRVCKTAASVVRLVLGMHRL